MTISQGPDLRSTFPDGGGIPAEIPSFSSAPIARTMLIERLDAIVDSDEHRVLLVCSPAGSGKTVLLADWAGRLRARTSRRPALGWVSVSEHSEPGLSLWQALRDQLGLPNPPQRLTVDAPGSDAAHLVEALTTRGTPTVIVIDDAHLVAEPIALAGLEHFLLHAPATVTTVVAGRFDPPLHWHLLGLTERSTRWGAADLAMTSTEVAALCREHHCELDDAELATVLDLTHGWAALVRITAMYLAANADRAAALGVLARPPRAVSDFLVGELIGALPASLRLFLTYTSVPASFTERMADELIGGGATHTLYQLDRMNFPVSSIARGGDVWFSYHPMLRAYFLAEVNRLGAHARAELHLRTANALRHAGLPRQALTHLLAVGDPRHLRDLLIEHGTTMVLDGDGATLFGELQRARPSLLDDPFVWLLRVLDALFHGTAADAQAYLDVANSRAGRPSFVPAHWIDALTVATTVDAAAATGTVSGDLAVAAVPPTGNPDIDCYLAIQSATALVVGGRLGRGEEALSRGLALALHTGHPRLALRALTRLTFIACGREATAAMRDRAARALALAAEHGLLDTPDAAQAMTAAGLAAYLRGEEPDPSHVAAALTHHAVQDGSESPLAGWHGYVVGQLLAVEQAADRRAAVDDLRRATQLLLDKNTVPAATATVIPHAVWALLSVSEPLAAQLLAERGQRLLGDLPDVTVARAAVAEAAGHSQAALALVEPLLELDGADDARPSTLVTGWLLYSSAQHAIGNRAKARTGLENALRNAAADHLVRPFLDVPNAIELLDVYAGRLGRLDAFGDIVRQNRNTARRSTHPALTDAEMTVLKHLPSGRTAQQIAGDLGVSINTVKTHLRSIYAKFGANSRVAALDFARRSGVL
ncbi:LuxR family transcriptional regulator, maltose regulon positive regulatory protein [Nocardia amikacinitolerans]|uniref:helix-turn-helix transcriptional regulator n=1 Tax=Nocardia amikacinitolerans TaxID=756689 RepID=UPI0020A26BDF|nr:LuxR C-terminal-related transcriptional regulator [Nocardia amikacinitolerans]MCP2297628.1 LuxR family transcriptional regulator, maltose regulon positive regulatory protein [Nocardia amikacinitolerans]